VRRRESTIPHSGDDEASAATPAVAYVRMSTDHQKYSTENQLDAIRRYATARGLEIIRVFEDSGRSGLRLDGREALQKLMAEVQSGKADFSAILVYDVSRWGRFRMPMKAHTMSMSARALAFGSTIAASSSRTTARSGPTC
jgi:DNA invertase Pin-like site-specific DNA recombinase